MKRIVAMTAVVALAGCALDKQTAPGLAGPSELGLSLAVSASSDHLLWDGKSTAVLEVIARDASSQPVRCLNVHVSADSGQLSSGIISTNNEGKANVVFTVPATPPLSTREDAIATVLFEPVGGNAGCGTSYPGNYANSGLNVKHLTIRLMLPFPVQPPAGPIVPKFFATPTTAKENEDVNFDGSASTGEIAKYIWRFGDGREGEGKFARYSYGLAGSYQVTLTVEDSKGNSATSAPQTITVGAATDLKADFVFSPVQPKQHQQVFFTAEGSTAPTGREIVSYVWDFGDGTFGSGVKVSHSWPTAQSFTVTLTVTDNTGRKATISKPVAIIP